MPYQTHQTTGAVHNVLPPAYGIFATWRGYGTLGRAARKAMLTQRRKDQLLRQGIGVPMHPEKRAWRTRGHKSNSQESIRRARQGHQP